MIIEMILEIALHAQTKRNDTRGKKQSSIQWPSASSFVVVFLATKKQKLRKSPNFFIKIN